MASFVNTTFLEWTDGLDARRSRISIFKHIHDISYSLAFPITDPKTTPDQILMLGTRGCDLGSPPETVRLPGKRTSGRKVGNPVLCKTVTICDLYGVLPDCDQRTVPTRA
jgi:hypothetical protein